MEDTNVYSIVGKMVSIHAPARHARFVIEYAANARYFAAIYKHKDTIHVVAPDHRRAVHHEMSRPLVEVFFDWLTAQAACVSG